MFGKKHSDNGEKIYRYSIRKYHFGAASVAVAALMFFANGVAAQAQTPAVSPVTASDVVAGPSGNSDGDPQDSDEESPEKTAVVEQPVELKSSGESSAPEAKTEEGSREESEAEVKSPQPETKIDDKEEAPQVAKEKEQEGSAPVADTSAAKSAQRSLETLLPNLTLDSRKPLRAEVEEGLAKAKAVLENPKATQAQVDEQVKLMEDLTRRVKEAFLLRFFFFFDEIEAQKSPIKISDNMAKKVCVLLFKFAKIVYNNTVSKFVFLYSMKIKEQTRKLVAGCSKHCFEVADRTDEVSNIYTARRR